ncbi:MAG: hypothetical protein ACD_16C00192G0017 [uncultured bacterium]|nr:MAG: hypothetical protein ACD_16C00192G0017 [uncultured bacterium]OFW68171.1 MAG: hypothetical protein A2X70_05700 [Alphaproteobacteria bacterium GWC2_42_16]OFW73564.1 MAG: hypothetical protein A2Z80_07000 [Alphaproteobacteria bacterium GWA2_41_27]OFW82413.1 MAG: hypothetical protein A3E50_04400 [Alphaproteobacteria bacterium RIFCSPHIGHO2_12_FULL_42_100]OFW86237.1 MAG: hypothetical protein A2W06_01330 [Alphaproteobacteria bacterium RBG_16_42_14]OFW91797.1 MAG: hypothetical protein A3C41_013
MLILLTKIIFILLNVLVGLYDFSFYRIPNSLLIGLLVLYGLTMPFILGFDEIMNSLVVFGVVLAICVIFFLSKIFGAGDAKYFSVVALWMGYPDVIPFVIYTSLVGGAVALLYLTAQHFLDWLSDFIWNLIQRLEERMPLFQAIWLGSGIGPEKGKREHIKPKVIPYGIAIAVGAIIMLKQMF